MEGVIFDAPEASTEISRVQTSLGISNVAQHCQYVLEMVLILLALLCLLMALMWFFIYWDYFVYS